MPPRMRDESNVVLLPSDFTGTLQLYLPHKALVSVSTQHFTLMSVNLCFTTFQAAELLSSYTTFHSPKTAAEMLEAMKSIVLYFIILQCL